MSAVAWRVRAALTSWPCLLRGIKAHIGDVAVYDRCIAQGGIGTAVSDSGDVELGANDQVGCGIDGRNVARPKDLATK